MTFIESGLSEPASAGSQVVSPRRRHNGVRRIGSNAQPTQLLPGHTWDRTRSTDRGCLVLGSAQALADPERGLARRRLRGSIAVESRNGQALSRQAPEWLHSEGCAASPSSRGGAPAASHSSMVQRSHRTARLKRTGLGKRPLASMRLTVAVLTPRNSASSSTLKVPRRGKRFSGLAVNVLCIGMAVSFA